ncbi:AbrB/MazE/SpoVT family DNA-binding domain-containing protein [uncultured Fusobacterium sp.]|uniref:AbrB/MazE/SpoVT family DNA-binding domain-containing protein n=1 Tax=uncultured Fusobacterium sp. TaxID=159267 RepID=UPI0025FCAFE1|nr:AbrB/MazE/SpoVT family DNA-binding domain-containing protein [uncultured Fusobacterium sp.]
MEKRELNISFYKAGNGEATRISLPKPWLRELGITKENKTVELIYDKENEQLIIRKKK